MEISSSLSELQHQNHVLQQYSSPNQHHPRREEKQPVYEEQQVLSPSLASLTIPTPHLTFPSTWQTNKSLPPQRPIRHICERERLMSTSPPPPPGECESRAGSMVSVELSPFHERRPPVVHAWAPLVSTQPKGTLLSSARLTPSQPSRWVQYALGTT